LKELLETVEKVLDSKSEEVAMKLLPPQEGFFFGSTEIDEYYWDDLEYTKNNLKKELEWFEKMPEDVYPCWEYKSSW
jgi:hypothetical protein